MASAQTTTPDPKADQSKPAKAGFGSKRIKLAAIVVGVMVMMAVAAALLSPKGEHTKSAEAAEAPNHFEDSPEKMDNLGEVEIGNFSSSIELDDGILWFVSFRLHAMVNSSAKTHLTEAVNESYKARVKQAVMKVLRMSSIADLRDPQLDLLKRNLKTEVNNVLPSRYIQEIIVSEIRTMQQ